MDQVSDSDYPAEMVSKAGEPLHLCCYGWDYWDELRKTPDLTDYSAPFLSRFVRETGRQLLIRCSQFPCQVVDDIEKNLNPNVDFYAASVYHMLGIPTHLFTPIFACSRVAGWSAHILEQYQNNRLIRPRADYVGHQSRKYISPE